MKPRNRDKRSARKEVRAMKHLSLDEQRVFKKAFPKSVTFPEDSDLPLQTGEKVSVKDQWQMPGGKE